MSTSAGMMSVARMPWLRSVLWTCCMRLRTAALAAPYGAPPIKPAFSAASEPTVTMVPRWRSIIPGSTACVSR